jgi:hypothetical protein
MALSQRYGGATAASARQGGGCSPTIAARQAGGADGLVAVPTVRPQPRRHRSRLRKTYQTATLCRVPSVGRSDTTTNTGTTAPHRKCRCADKRQRHRQSDCRELHCQFDPERVTGGA